MIVYEQVLGFAERSCAPRIQPVQATSGRVICTPTV